MISNIPNLNALPDSPFAAQLRKEPFPARFPQPLEDAYVDDHLRRARLRARSWTLLALVLAIGFTVAQTLAGPVWSPAVLAHWLVVSPVASVMTWLAWSRDRMRQYLQVTRLLAPLLGFSVAAAVAQAVTQGAAEEMGSLMLLMMATFFFIGLLPRAAMLAGLAILTGFGVAAPLAGMPAPLYLKCFAILAAGGAAGAMVCREADRSYRKRFLEEGLIRELMDRDSLTGLRNRRALDEHVARIWQQCLRHRNQLAVLMIDIDYFKHYNDRYGHQAGDAALCKVAAVVQQFARRPLDISARFGGEEFAIVLFDIAPATVHEIAEGLRSAVEAADIAHAASECAPHITVSVGAAIVQPALGRAPRGAIQLADEALYQAKKDGRNRCVVEGQSEYEALVTGQYRYPGASRQRA